MYHHHDPTVSCRLKSLHDMKGTTPVPMSMAQCYTAPHKDRFSHLRSIALKGTLSILIQ